MYRILAVCILLQLASCGLLISREQTNLRSDNIESVDSPSEELTQEANPDCDTLKRPLNPSEQPALSESELDKYFRLAFAYETAANFDQAIFYYGEAAKLSDCECDTLHAEAGQQAAKEAQELLQQAGMSAKPTQFFWGRLQQLTEDFPCVEIN